MNFLKALFRAIIACVWAIIFMGLLYSTYVYELFWTEKTITIAAWGDIFDASILAEFQKETGIKINLSYYSSNEELLVKLKKTGGKGFDLIVPSDYAVQSLREEQLLKKMDTSQLTFFDDLNPVLLGHQFDPHNDYSIPWSWELFGVGIDAAVFNQEGIKNPWDLIWCSPVQCYNNPAPYSITMVNDPIEMVMLASLHLFNDVHPLSPEQLLQVEKLLKDQKRAVKAYVDFRADYFLATGNCAAVVSSSSYILRSQRQFPSIVFLVPERTFVTIENCAISAATKSEKLVYQLLNYLYKPENMIKNSKEFAVFPSTLSTLELLPEGSQQKRIASLSSQKFSNFLFFKKYMNQIDLIRLWASIKS